MVDETNRIEAREWVRKGRAALRAKNIKIARECLHKARDLDPSNSDAWLYLAVITRDLRKRKAILERVIAIDPGHEKALAALARVEDQLLQQVSDMDESPQPTVHVPEPGEKEASAEEQASELQTADDGYAVVEEAEDVAAPDAVHGESRKLPEFDGSLEQADAAMMQAHLNAAISKAESLMAAMAGLAHHETEAASTIEVTGTDVEDPTQSIAQVSLGRCPRCGAVMRAHHDTGRGVCVFCGYESSAAESGVSAVLWTNATVPWPVSQQARHCLTCDTISVPEVGQGLEASPCPICQQSIFEPFLGGVGTPDSQISFQVNEAQAAIALEDAPARRGTGLRLRRQRQMSRPRKAYLPVWYFNGVSQTEYELGGRAQNRGRHSEAYENVPVHTVPQIDGELLRLASDVDLAETRPLESLEGILLLLPNIPVQTALTDARGLMLQDTRQKARRKVRTTGSPAEREAADSIAFRIATIEDMTVQLVLLPVWLNEVHDGGRLYTGLVNGVTGKAMLGPAVRRRR
jgi:tetratricopeptide (TPR) repeat protein